jgi:hypothetical protein
VRQDRADGSGCAAGGDVDRVRDADDAHRNCRIVHRHGKMPLSRCCRRVLAPVLLCSHCFLLQIGVLIYSLVQQAYEKKK